MATQTNQITSGPAVQQLEFGTQKYYSVLIPTGGASINFAYDAQNQFPIGTAVAGTVFQFTSYTPVYYWSTSPSGATVTSSSLKLASTLASAFTSVVSTASETITGQVKIPSNLFFAGAILKIRYQATCTGVTSTPTLAHKLYFGTLGTTSDTALITGSTTAILANGIVTGEFELVVEAAPSTATAVVGTGSYALAGAAGQTVVNATLASTNFNTTLATYVTLTLQWSASSASNAAIGTVLDIEIF